MIESHLNKSSVKNVLNKTEDHYNRHLDTIITNFFIELNEKNQLDEDKQKSCETDNEDELNQNDQIKIYKDEEQDSFSENFVSSNKILKKENSNVCIFF